MKKRLFGLFVSILLFLVLPQMPTFADDTSPCTLEAAISGNHANITVSTGDGYSGYLDPTPFSTPLQFGNGAGVNPQMNNGVANVGTDYANGNYTIAVVSGAYRCSKSITVGSPTGGNPPPNNGNNNSPVGNAAYYGHGVDDCRFFVSASAKYYAKAVVDKTGKVIVEANSLVVDITKMGPGSNPFTAYVESRGKTPWHVQSDPDLSGEGGKGSAVYNLPYVEVLKDKSIKEVFVSVFNAITGDRCTDPIPVKIR